MTSKPSRLWWAPDIPIEYTRVNGTNIRYIKTGQGPNLVLLHTVRSQLDIYCDVIPKLSQGYTIHAFDYPGHGWSYIPRTEYTPTLFADTVEAFLANREITDAKVAGVSIGGTLGLILAARRNPRVTRVVAINPFDYLGGGIGRGNAIGAVLFAMLNVPVVGAVGMALNFPWLERKVLEGGVTNPSFLSKELLKAFWQVGRRPGFAPAFRNLFKHIDEWNEVKAAYPDITVPVRLVYGDKDWARPAERARTAELIPNVDLKTVANGGHLLMLDHPATVASLIDEF